MGLSERDRAKQTKAALQKLPAGTQARTFVQGRGHARLSNGAMVAGAVFFTVFVVALALGVILFPGLLLIAYVYAEVLPPRSVVVTEEGLVIMGRSLWNGKPTKMVAFLPPAPFHSVATAGAVTLALGSERITFKRKEFDRLAAATATAPYGAAGPAWAVAPTKDRPAF